MADTAAHLIDRVLPWVPVRQWVLSLPFAIRFLVAFDKKTCRDIRRIFVRTVLSSIRKRAGGPGLAEAQTGAVCFTQRFGCRVDREGRPSRPLTDPDVWNYHIRLLDLQLRSRGAARSKSSGREWVVFEKTIEGFPVQTTPLGAPVEPLLP